ncbi:hypothetical protein [Mucilaginibacter corticis]|uniref:hypothetical protein n=1 Tax=Mucilaginibacter corticis TaxID=2597670 RepID=UPI0016427599|nr:hypothetical protein [Mucilaginibacter corticis]
MIVKNLFKQPSLGLFSGAVPTVLSISFGHFHVLAADASESRKHLTLLLPQS